MDNFIGNPNAFLWEVASGFIGHGHCPLHPPTETEGFCQVNGEPSFCELVVIGANLLNEVTLVSLFQSGSHLIGASKAPAVVVAGVVEGASKGLGINDVSHGSSSRLLPVYGKRAPRG